MNKWKWRLVQYSDLFYKWSIYLSNWSAVQNSSVDLLDTVNSPSPVSLLLDQNS